MLFEQALFKTIERKSWSVPYCSCFEAYKRDPYAIEAVKRRAKGKCEMPSCECKAFITENDKLYLRRPSY